MKSGGASSGMRSGVNSTGDTILVNSNLDMVPPNSAPENIQDTSQKSNKKLKVVDVELNRNQGVSRQGQIAQSNSTAGKHVSNKQYNVPTHRRSNTAASFMPTMTLK